MGLVQIVKGFVKPKTEKDILGELVSALTQLAKASAEHYKIRSEESEKLIDKLLEEENNLCSKLVKQGVEDPIKFLRGHGYIYLKLGIENPNLPIFGRICSEGTDFNIFGDEYSWHKFEMVNKSYSNEIEYPPFIGWGLNNSALYVNLIAIKDYLMKHTIPVLKSLMYDKDTISLEELKYDTSSPLMCLDVKFAEPYARIALNGLTKEQVGNLDQQEKEKIGKEFLNLCLDDYLQSMLFKLSCITSLQIDNSETPIIIELITMMYKPCFLQLNYPINKELFILFGEELLGRFEIPEIPKTERIIYYELLTLEQMQDIAESIYRKRYIESDNDYGYSEEILSKIKGLKFQGGGN